jgi:hypothetical protein
MAWSPTFDTGLGTIGLVVSILGVWVSWKSLKEAELAKKAAVSAEAAAKDAKDAVRREDRKAKLITKLTQLLTQTNNIRAKDENLQEAECEPSLIELRRELVACATAAAGNYEPLANRLKIAAISIDDIDGQREGDNPEVIIIRRRLLIDLGNTISESHSELELGTYDNGT